MQPYTIITKRQSRYKRLKEILGELPTLKMEKHIPIPPTKWIITATLRKMKRGHSYTVDTVSKRSMTSALAIELKIPIYTTKIKSGYRIWRL